MVDKNVYCVGTAVLHKKEQLVLIRPVENLLVMTVLKYADQIKSATAFDDDGDGDGAVARFTYTVSDGNGHEVDGEVTVTVLPEALPAR